MGKFRELLYACGIVNCDMEVVDHVLYVSFNISNIDMYRDNFKILMSIIICGIFYGSK